VPGLGEREPRLTAQDEESPGELLLTVLVPPVRRLGVDLGVYREQLSRLRGRLPAVERAESQVGRGHPQILPRPHTGLVSPPPAVRRLPALPGVYRFRGSRGDVLYVGRASQLRSRVASYWADRPDRQYLAGMTARIDRIEAVVCDSAHEAAWLEYNLHESRLPPWNRAIGSAESVLYLRLDERPRSPRLSAEHVLVSTPGVRYFGPYLGGARARLAVTALNRILPVSYTSARLAGAQLDLARVRGYVDVDRESVIESVTEILNRDLQAVTWARSELEELRACAARAESFELAGRIQEELEALAWVTCPQRAATVDGGDFTACGWAEGILVRFGVRAGRLREWSQRPCGQATAAPYLAATPPGWAEFAQRNAELAASLGQPAAT
jgi:excinuclease ABC subunit C